MRFKFQQYEHANREGMFLKNKKAYEVFVFNQKSKVRMFIGENRSWNKVCWNKNWRHMWKSGRISQCFALNKAVSCKQDFNELLLRAALT